MKGNLLGIFFSILSCVLVVLIVLAYGRSDRIQPEFRFSALDLIYDSTTTERQLKEGVNAYDAKDGDLTGRIVVEKVVLNRDAGTAVVYYAVSDYSGNVAKQSRIFPADIEDLESDGETIEEEEEQILLPEMNLEESAAEAASEASSGF
ncbi:MAG: DUF5011 domain-containing protein [Butyrivibrio sp.]|nr:DUF5011 domain-containing protein [Butyrivibrio sp.]